MKSESNDSDIEVKWLSVEEPEKKTRSRQSVNFYLLLGLAILISIGAITAVAKRIVAIAESRNQAVIAARQRSQETLNAESVEAYSTFDAAEDSLTQLSEQKRKEHVAIQALFREIESLANEGNSSKFRSLFDFDRLMKRIEFTGGLRGWTHLEKKYVRTDLKNTLEIEPEWKKVLVVKVLEAIGDPDSRVVYALCSESEEDDYDVYRFLISRLDNKWQIYDWEDLDLGMSVSEEWGIYTAHSGTKKYDNYATWNDLIVEADAIAGQGDYEKAIAKLSQADSLVVPRELIDYCLLLSSYRWDAYGENVDVERCLKNANNPVGTPGIYLVLMNCNRWKDPSKALFFADIYESTIGPVPALCRTKAQLLRELGRKQDAVEQWKKLLRVLPNDITALSEICRAIPEDKKDSFGNYLDQRNVLAATVAEVANRVAYDDYPALLYLEQYLQRKDLSSAKTLNVAGLAKFLDGQYAAAADFFRQAYESESEAEQRNIYVNNYLRAMAANGQVLPGWKDVPDPVSAFLWLTNMYDDEAISISKQEYQQLVELFRKQYPANQHGLIRESILASEQDRFQDAEQLLNKAIERNLTNSDNEDQEYFQGRCHHLLTNVLYKQDKLAKAYNISDDQSERFIQLVLLAKEEDRYDDLEKLLQLHRSNMPKDPYVLYAKGELAVHEERWHDAIDFFLQGVEATAETNKGWQFKNRLQAVCVQSGYWQKYYQQSKDRSQTFYSLAESYLQNKDWKPFGQLLDHHRKQLPGDLLIVQIEASAAWARKDYQSYVSCAEAVLDNDDGSTLLQYQRNSIENRLFSALLQNKDYKKAEKNAHTKLEKQNDASPLAIVNVARGNLIEARRLALNAARQNDSASNFYSNNDVGLTFLRDEFLPLQEKFPIKIPSNSASKLAVFLCETPCQISAKEISNALNEIGVKTQAIPESLNTIDNSGMRAFVLQFDKASLWIAIGSGKFDNQWTLSNKSPQLTNAVKNTQTWLAVGTAAWTAPIRKENEALARFLAAKLMEEHAKAICLESSQSWQPWTVIPASEELISAWKSQGNTKEILDSGSMLEEKNYTQDVEGNRKFSAQLRKAIRSFELGKNIKFQVMVSLTNDVVLDPLWLNVSKVERSYGRVHFEGYLQDGSKLITHINNWLPLVVHESEVRALRISDDEAAVIFRNLNQ